MRLPITLGVTVVSALALSGLQAQTGAEDPKYPTKIGDKRIVDKGMCVTADKLLSHDIKNLEDEAKGKIEELAFDPDNGRVLFALVSCEEHDDKLFAVPLSKLTIEQAEDVGEIMVRWSPTEAEVMALPSIAEEDWDQATSVSFASTVRTHFGEDRQIAIGEVDAHRISPNRIVRVSKIIGGEVKDVNGEDVGKVSNLVLNSKTGRVDFAVVEADGGLFGASSQHAVPLKALQHRDATEDEKEYCRLSVTEDALQKAPKFDADKLRAQDRTFIDQVYRHFGMTAPMYDAHDKDGLRDPSKDPNRGNNPPPGGVRRDG